MKFLAFLSLFLIGFASQAQFPVSPNARTENGERTGQWTILYDSAWHLITNPDSAEYYRLARFENGKPVGKVRDFFRSGQKQWDGYLISVNPDLFDGEYNQYHENGKLKTAAHYKSGISNGSYKEYSAKGVLITEGIRENDRAVGRWLYYYESGKLMADVMRIDGKEHGPKITYYESGQISAKGIMKDDKQEAIWETYYENGKLKNRSNYVNGELNGFSEGYYDDGMLKEKGQCKDGYYSGYWRFYFPNGKIESEGNFISSLGRTGHWKRYNEDGSLGSEYEMINNQKEGSFTSYHANGKVAGQGFYKDGHFSGPWTYFNDQNSMTAKGSYYNTDSMTGKWIYYYANGNVQSEGTYVKNKEEGPWIFHFENGDVELIENHKDSQLHGEWIKYYANGKVLEKKNFDHGYRTGDYATYYDNGQVKKAGVYTHGLKIGEWMSYYTNGITDEKSAFISDTLDGKFLSYFEDGKLFEEGVYDKGKKIGVWNDYYSNGQLSMRQEYLNGRFTSVSYFRTGNKKSESQGTGTGPDNLKEEGYRRQYFSNGKLESEGTRINGLSEGKFIFYDSISGKRITEGEFFHGKYDKTWKFYTDKGKLSSTQIYIKGFRESVKNVADSISKLIELEDYDQAQAQFAWLNRVLKRDVPKSDIRWLRPVQLQGDIYFGRKQYDKSLTIYQQVANEIKRIEGDTTNNYLNVLNGIAVSYSGLGNHEEALKIDQLLLAKWKEKKEEYVLFVNNSAADLNALGRAAEGEDMLRKEWESRKALYGDSSIQTLKALSYFARFQSNHEFKYEAALESFKELYHYSKEEGPYYLSTLRESSNVLKRLNRYKDAVDVLEVTIEYEVAHKLDGYADYFEDIISLSEAYYATYEYDKALKVVMDVLTKLQSNNKGASYEAARLFLRASFVERNAVNNFNLAIEYAERAKEILENLGQQESGLYASVIDQQASNHFTNPLTYGQAEKYYKLAIVLSDKRDGDRSASHYTDMLSLANYYTNGFKLTRADSVFKIVGKDIYQRLDSTSSVLSRYERVLGTWYLFNYQYSDAILHHQKAVDFYRSRNDAEYQDYNTALLLLADTYSVAENRPKAESLIREALALYEKHNNTRSSQYFEAQTQLAGNLQKQLLYKDAEVIYLSVIKSFDEVFGENNSWYNDVLFRLGEIQIAMNEYKKAEENMTKAMSLSLKNSGPVPTENYYFMLQTMAGLKILQNDFNAAENYFNQAKIAAQPYRDHVSYYLLLQKYGNFEADRGRYAQAEQLLTEGLDVVNKLVGEHHWFYAYMGIDLVKVYQQLGKNAEAEKLISKAMAIAESNKVDSESSYISVMRSLVQNLRTMGRYQDAEKQENTIVAYAEKQGGKNVRYAVEVLDLALINYDLKRYEKAKELFKASIAIFEENLAKDHENILIANNQLGLVYLALGEIDEAQKCFQYEIDQRIVNGKTNSSSHIVALHNMGNALMREGKFEEAEKSYNASIALRAKLKMEYNLEWEVSLLDDIAILYQSWGKDELAEKYWKETLQKMLTYIRTNFSFLSDYEKAKFWERTKFDFENFNTFAVHRAEKNPLILGDMYNYRLATKGILLSASNKLRKRIYASHDSTLIHQYHQWTELREQVAKEYTTVASTQKTPHIDSLERSVNVLEKELSISTEDSKADRDQLITWKEVQRTLAPDEAAIELIRFHYFNRALTDSVIYAALVITAETKTNPKLVVMGNGDFLDTKAYRYYRNSITSQLDDQQSYQNFWGKIEPLVSNKKRIYLSLDGVFNQVNLKTLQAPDGTYLMDSKDFVIVSNTRDLIAMKSRKRLKLMETASLIGNPKFFMGGQSKTTSGSTRDVDQEDRSGIAELPGTKVEIEAVESLLDANGWKVNALVQTEATEEHMKQLQSSRVVHLATHGFFQDDKNGSWSTQDPMLRSGILLTGAANFMQSKQETDGENGILTAYEAANLSLEGTEMVVLSACETARGEIQQGEGVYGLQRAFITAGAESLVMSLWKVDDEATQKLMSLFYENWMKGMEKSEALTEAQRTLKKLYPHPYYWGAFVMMRG